MKKTFMKLTSVLFVALLGLWSTDAQAGCNDITACNYVSTDTDADDCAYDYTITVGGGTFDSEISWTLFDSGGLVVASGGAPVAIPVCLGDDCYILDMVDSFGDGWNGANAVLTLDSDGSTVFTSTVATGTNASAFWTIGTPGCIVEGCTDPTACNFDSTLGANSDDGSCEFASCTGCTDPAFCEFDSTATISDFTLCLTTIGCFDSTSCLFDVNAACGDQAVLCAVNALDLCVDAQDLGSATTTVTVDNGNTCVDEAASESAGVWYRFTTPAGPTVHTFSCTGDGTWDNQIEVFDGCPGAGGVQVAFDDDSNDLNAYFELEIGCDVLAPSTEYWVMVDGFIGQEGTCDMTMTVDEIFCLQGCTNPLALNFDTGAAIDDGSCIVADCGSTTPDATATYCYGNGENGNVLAFAATNPGDQVILEFVEGTIENPIFDVITITDADGTVLYTNAGVAGTVDLGSNGLNFPTENVIVESITGFINISVTSDGSVSCGSFNYVPWLINVYCGAEAIPGCTDSTACNFNSLATDDDGSCCFDTCVELTVGGGTFDTEVSWTLTDFATGTVVGTGGAPVTTTLCIVDGCYQFDMVDSFGDGWNGATYTFTNPADGTVLFSGSLETASDFVVDGLSGTDFLDFGGTGTCPVFGCTDAGACNFDTTATDDDGSCCFENCVTLSVGGGLNDLDIFFFVEGSDGTNVYGDGVAQFAPFNEFVCLPDDCYTLRLLSSFGLGWVGGTVDITDETGAVLYTGTFDSGEGDGGFLSLHLFSVGGVPCATCQDPNACNFDSSGIYNDCDACEYLSCAGCTYAFASNFDAAATYDDGSCLPPTVCPGDADGSGAVDILDIVAVSSNFGSSCL